MLPSVSGTGLGPVPQVDRVAPAERGGDPRREAFQRTLSTMLGAEVRAAVLSRLQDGSFLVRVADTQVRMQLPPGVRVGAELPMTVLAAFPQPTFRIGEAALPATPAMTAAWSGGADVVAHTEALPGKAPLVPAALLSQLPHDPEAASLSPAARLLTDVISTANSRPGSAALTATAPLVNGPVADPVQLAGQLQGAISQSGLFYESHVAQWAEGKRGMAELSTEPQMLQRPGSPVSDPATAQFVNLQLATHEQAHVAWHGQLGAGQPLEWQINKDAPDAQQQDGTPAEPGWRSGLRLRFALLGEVEANVTLRGAQLHIELRAGSEAAGALLRGHAAQLGAALEAAGTPLTSLRIGSQGEASDD
ncbi:MAG TPA: flagellar hook-length control protein FliK [Telluria sp.]